jgi:hypothetical protein
MPVIRLSGFNGENRAIHPRLVPDNVGVVSRNQKPGRGDLRPWKQPTTVATVPGGRPTIYRMGRDVDSDSAFWLSWTNAVHAVRGFDPEDTSERTYYSGDGVPKVTDNIMGLASPPYPTSNRPLGVPAPATPILVTADPPPPPEEGADPAEPATYFYVYTYVNDWGWESAPSPVSLENVRQTDATAALTGFASPPSGNYQINRMRIYRTETGASGIAEFFFLREIAIGVSTTQDDNRALGEVLPTANWAMPPANLYQLTSLWNGMLAGISGNAVRMCEPYTPYAWPESYDIIPPDSKPVALGVFGQTLIVLTTGRPLAVAGSTPEAMDQQLLEIPQACIAPRSVASMGVGVAWASEDGLCWFGAGGAKVATAGLLTREDWQAMNPASMIGRMYEGMYFGSYLDGLVRRMFMIDPANPTGVFFLDTGYEAMHFDELKDQLYVLSGADVQKWDTGALMTTRFRSKEFRMPRPLNFACAEVVADTYPLTFRLFADGVLRHTQVVSSRNPFRLPSGFMALDWQMEIEGTSAVQGAAIATSMTEIAQA